MREGLLKPASRYRAEHPGRFMLWRNRIHKAMERDDWRPDMTDLSDTAEFKRKKTILWLSPSKESDIQN